MNEPNAAVLQAHISHLESDLRELKEDHRRLKAHLTNYEKEEAAKERKQLLVGITALGSAIIGLIGIIWTFRGVILK